MVVIALAVLCIVVDGIGCVGLSCNGGIGSVVS